MIALKTGDIILVHTPFDLLPPTTWLSALIRFFDKTYYNHCKLVVCNWGVPFINEALVRGIETCNSNYNLKGKIIVIRRPKENFDEQYFAILANSFVGDTKYNFFALIQQLIYRSFGIWISTNKDLSTDKFYCSDYCAYMHNMKEWWKISPRELFNSELFETIYQN